MTDREDELRKKIRELVNQIYRNVKFRRQSILR